MSFVFDLFPPEPCTGLANLHECWAVRIACVYSRDTKGLFAHPLCTITNCVRTISNCTRTLTAHNIGGRAATRPLVRHAHRSRTHTTHARAGEVCGSAARALALCATTRTTHDTDDADGGATGASVALLVVPWAACARRCTRALARTAADRCSRK